MELCSTKINADPPISSEGVERGNREKGMELVPLLYLAVFPHDVRNNAWIDLQ